MGLTATQFLALSAGTQGVSSIAETYSTYQANKANSIYERNIYDTNARIANIQAGETLRRGETRAGEIKRQGRQISGSQRAAYAGQGVLVDAGTPGTVQDETGYLSELDAITARNNAQMEAFGFKSQALQSQSQKEFSKISSRFTGRSTLLTGGLTALRYGLEAGYYAKSGKFVPRNPIERRFDFDYRNRR